MAAPSAILHKTMAIRPLLQSICIYSRYARLIQKQIFQARRSSYSVPVRASAEIVIQAIKEIESSIGKEYVSISNAVREQHGKDESFHEIHKPDAVVFPTSLENVCDTVRILEKYRIPMIPFGTGTGLEGGISAIHGGVCIDVARNMTSICETHVQDMSCAVEPGVTRQALNSHLRDTGLFFPVDPGSEASLCGMCATSASGTNAVKYGTMRENVLNLEVVLPNGKVIYTAGKGRRNRKSSAGYNLTNLFVGSEGTLGIITKATIRLYGRPEVMAAAVCSFPDIRSAIVTTTEVLQSSIPVARIEFLDEVTINACNKYSNTNYRAVPTLFLEFHGSHASVKSQAEVVQEISSSNNSYEFHWAVDEDERLALWRARHDAWYACKAVKPGCQGYSSDVCVPISKLAEIIEDTKKDIEDSKIFGPIVGHVGDGNFHCLMFSTSLEEKNTIKKLSDRIVRRAQAVGGTCTGEHGVGLGKKTYLEYEFGADAINVMWNLKKSLDPYNLMNPGKLLPTLK